MVILSVCMPLQRPMPSMNASIMDICICWYHFAMLPNCLFYLQGGWSECTCGAWGGANVSAQSYPPRWCQPVPKSARWRKEASCGSSLGGFLDGWSFQTNPLKDKYIFVQQLHTKPILGLHDWNFCHLPNQPNRENFEIGVKGKHLIPQEIPVCLPRALISNCNNDCLG